MKIVVTNPEHQKTLREVMTKYTSMTPSLAQVQFLMGIGNWLIDNGYVTKEQLSNEAIEIELLNEEVTDER